MLLVDHDQKTDKGKQVMVILSVYTHMDYFAHTSRKIQSFNMYCGLNSFKNYLYHIILTKVYSANFSI